MSKFTAHGASHGDAPRGSVGVANGGTTAEQPEHRAALAWLEGRARVLEHVALGDPLPRVLGEINRLVESHVPGGRCSVLVLDERARALRCGAAASLPAGYNALVEGLPIGPNTGACGTAAHLGRRVIVDDVATDPTYPADFRARVLAHGLAACWAEPVVGRDGAVLGTFAIYLPRPARPTGGDGQRLEAGARLAGVALERQRTGFDRRVAEAARRQGHALLRAVADASTDVMFVKDRDGRYLYVNPAGAALIGRPPEDVVGRTDELWLAPDLAARIAGDDRDVMAAAAPRTYEQTIAIGTDGSTRTFLTTKAPYRDVDGDVIGVVGIARDVTDRKAAETRLRT